MNILEAISDPKLLGHGFQKRWLKADSWKNWRSFLSSCFGLPFEDDESFETFTQCTGRTTAPTKQFRECFLICGRRSGKSYLTAAIATFIAAFRDHTPFLSPGEAAIVAVVAADKSQAAIILKYIRGFFHASPVLRSQLVSDLKEMISLRNGVELQVLTADYRSVRGRTLCAALVDELAFLNSSDGSANPDSGVLEALRPSLISIPDSILVGLSSPYAKRGELYRQYQMNYGQDNSDVLVWKASSSTMNPTISKLAIASAFARDPISARTEYSAEFRDDLCGFISEEVLRACVVPGRSSLPKFPNVTYSAFADLSGGRSDSATLAIGHEESGRGILDVVIERLAPHIPQQVTKEFCALLKQFGISTCTADRYSAEWGVSEFNKNGISLRHSDKNRSEIYLEILPMILSQQVELLDNSRMIQQFVGLERRVGRNQDQVDHAPGQHDDLSNSVAGALVQLSGAGFWPLQFAQDWKQQQAGLQPLSEVEQRAAVVAGGIGPSKTPANTDRRFGRGVFGEQKQIIRPTTAAIQKPVLFEVCPQCGARGLSSAGVTGPGADVRQLCGGCGWSQIVPRSVILIRH